MECGVIALTSSRIGVGNINGLRKTLSQLKAHYVARSVARIC